MVKLNTNGTFKDNNRDGCWRGLIRDSAGNWVGGFAKSLGWCSAFVV